MAKTENAPPQPLVTELNVSANIMAMEPGLYCVFHADNGAIDPVTGLPGVRITLPPGGADPELEIRTFGEGGWLGGAAALVQTPNQATVLVTVYRDAAAAAQGPQLQVVRLGDAPKPTRSVSAGEAVAARPAAPPAAVTAADVSAPESGSSQEQPAASAPDSSSAPISREEAEIAAHIQRRGDVLARIGEWMGTPGSQQWIEGFALAPRGEIGVKDIEYQAVLGRGWLSPWAEGGQFCGSRGMALPILGLRARLKGKFAETHSVSVEATFTDGTAIGPAEDDEPVEAPSLAPLEAFRLQLVPLAGAGGKVAQTKASAAPAHAAAETRPATAPTPARRAPARKAAPAPQGKVAPKGRGTASAPPRKPAAALKPAATRKSATPASSPAKGKPGLKPGARRRS